MHLLGWTRRIVSPLRLTPIWALVLVCLFVGAPTALAKDYSMGPVDIQATLNPDGSLDVSELRTYEFDGEFTRAYWELDRAQGTDITIVGVAGPEGAYVPNADAAPLDTRTPGTYWVEDTGGTVVVHAFHRSADEAKTFALTYRVTGAAKKWDDTGELYWQFIGDRWEVGASDVRVHVALPWPAGVPVTIEENLRAWGHGPLAGSVEPNADGSVDLYVSHLDPKTFVELRTVFPREALAQAADTPGSQLTQILEQEKGWADTKNSEIMKQRVIVGGVRWLSILVSFAALALAVVMFLRHGKEYTPEFKGEYFREEPAQLHPAIVGALWRMGTVEDGDVAATLMAMANRGVITMTPVDVEKKGFLG
ncbi:MAG: DUF2207 domain-containing protein, partial [Actinobacteria bacterium]|nr:DUF2207 domain-containing protein [Actinomycetota bacterium]